MKKLFATLAAVAVMAFSAVPAFAAEVYSPVATTAPCTSPCKPCTKDSANVVCVKDTSPISPKTGSSDMAVYGIIAASLTVCGAASVALVKSKK